MTRLEGQKEDNGWLDISQKPKSPLAVLFYFGALTFINQDEEPANFPEYREERVEVGFWDGECWCYAGTGHDVFEFHGMEGYADEAFPTHWMPLPNPPSP